MFLLQALESFLGDIEQWPSTTLDEPTPKIIRRVSAFFMKITYPIILLAISTKSVVNTAVNTLLILCTVIILFGEAPSIQNILLHIITWVSNDICTRLLMACARARLKL